VAIVGVFSGFMNDESLARPLQEVDELSQASGASIGMISWRMLAADTGESFVGTFDPALPGGTLESVAQGGLDARLAEVAGSR